MERRIYATIDLKSFYASVECVERGLDPLDANLVVADSERTEKTICLAVSPSMKGWGIPGRPRLFEVIAEVNRVNSERKASAHRPLSGSSYLDSELRRDPTLSLDYITAPPRMALYMEYSARIYGIYTKHVSPEDIHVYSVDEVFMDITSYLKMQKISARAFVKRIIKEVLEVTGITATAGIGTNLYLAKVAMDILAKRAEPDKWGVRIAELDEMSYRRILWEHRPLTDFWRVGRGYTKKLESHGIYTMGDVALTSVKNEDLLYKLFGINAELLIDHAWGYEPCTIADIKAYKPMSKSLNSGQVLHCPYDAEGGRLIVREMCDLLVLDMVDKGVATNQLTLTIGYDADSLKNPSRPYLGEVTVDYYGRAIPKHAHGSVNFPLHTSSTEEIMEGVLKLYDRIINPNLLIRRVNISVNNLIRESERCDDIENEQMDLFTDYDKKDREKKAKKARYDREKSKQNALIAIKKKYGGNAVLRGMNLTEGATTIDRNKQIGGHKA